MYGKANERNERTNERRKLPKNLQSGECTDSKGTVCLSRVAGGHRICPKGSKNDRIGNHSACQGRSSIVACSFKPQVKSSQFLFKLTQNNYN